MNINLKSTCDMLNHQIFELLFCIHGNEIVVNYQNEYIKIFNEKQMEAIRNGKMKYTEVRAFIEHVKLTIQ